MHNGQRLVCLGIMNKERTLPSAASLDDEMEEAMPVGVEGWRHQPLRHPERKLYAKETPHEQDRQVFNNERHKPVLKTGFKHTKSDQSWGLVKPKGSSVRMQDHVNSLAQTPQTVRKTSRRCSSVTGSLNDLVL